MILTGDCDYCHFGHLANAQVQGLVAPHHGASLKSEYSDMPTGTGDQSTLAYSFGPNNSHGKSRVQHPTVDGVALHNAWHHGGWRPARPGFGNPRPLVIVLFRSIRTFLFPTIDPLRDLSGRSGDAGARE